MCGRYAFDDIDEIYEARALLEEVAASLGEEAAQSVKKGEVFPADSAAVLAQTPGGYRPDVMRWGYPMRGSSRRIINARSETLSEKPMFLKSLIARKCLIPCTGFYEWRKHEGAKQKFMICPEGQRFFYLAGLFNTFYEDQQMYDHFVIITAPANEKMEHIHHRMPLIVPKTHIKYWLTGEADYTELMDDIYAMTDRMHIMAV